MTPRIEPLGDQGWLLVLGEKIDPAINDRVHRLASRLRCLAPIWLADCVPAYASLAVFVDWQRAVRADDPLAEAHACLGELLGEHDAGEMAADIGGDGKRHEIPVCYEDALAPDLADVAKHCGLPVEDVIARHLAGDYRVAMLGFAAGFPYLLGMDPILSTPRLATPRTRVPAGSLGIGGAQTGLYPQASPGGWRLIGRTPLRLFDATRASPSLLSPGDFVRFVRISTQEFTRIEASP